MITIMVDGKVLMTPTNVLFYFFYRSSDPFIKLLHNPTPHSGL